MHELRFRAVGVLGRGLVGGLFTTTRASREGQEHYERVRREGGNVLFVFWHAHLLPLVHYHRGEDIVVLVSEHADGEYITRVIARHGFGVARGSSTRGGRQGLRQLMRAARAGHDLAITPDGPRGPARVFKPGAMHTARLTGLPVVPLAVAASSAWHVDSWDRFLVPRPLARIRIVYGEPTFVDRDIDDEGVARLAAAFGERIDALEARARAGLAEGVR
jgi:hypothetical protein